MNPQGETEVKDGPMFRLSQHFIPALHLSLNSVYTAIIAVLCRHVEYASTSRPICTANLRAARAFSHFPRFEQGYKGSGRILNVNLLRIQDLIDSGSCNKLCPR
ncbi:hypothetical protein ARMGADRAFT_772579 [Armillaria gallica]|uniref:Uncharacterized protein n=1 Tax=Armillaria gallica TaxID=47427 RepID=A0A2H3CF56_ARMGA|nr:hypothetical protein ARMGADRAFT_772579 [Armillaria gallica]